MTRAGSNCGAGLVEVLVALALFSIVAAGLATTTIGSTRRNERSKAIAAAAALVHDKIEHLRALDPEKDPPDLAAGDHADPGNPMTATGTPGGIFTRSWSVQRDTPARGLARVVVRASATGPVPYTVLGVTYLCTSPTCT
jgi:type II secretory pathway pseudopilin PulG